MEKTKNNKNLELQSKIVPKICKKCGVGKMKSECEGRIYVCDNPKCKASIWFTV